MRALFRVRKGASIDDVQNEVSLAFDRLGNIVPRFVGPVAIGTSETRIAHGHGSVPESWKVANSKAGVVIRQTRAPDNKYLYLERQASLGDIANGTGSSPYPGSVHIGSVGGSGTTTDMMHLWGNVAGVSPFLTNDVSYQVTTVAWPPGTHVAGWPSRTWLAQRHVFGRRMTIDRLAVYVTFWSGTAALSLSLYDEATDGTQRPVNKLWASPANFTLGSGTGWLEATISPAITVEAGEALWAGHVAEMNVISQVHVLALGLDSGGSGQKPGWPHMGFPRPAVNGTFTGVLGDGGLAIEMRAYSPLVWSQVHNVTLASPYVWPTTWDNTGFAYNQVYNGANMIPAIFFHPAVAATTASTSDPAALDNESDALVTLELL